MGNSDAGNGAGRDETDPHGALARSVAWHLANPPEDASDDFSEDDKALAATMRPRGPDLRRALGGSV